MIISMANVELNKKGLSALADINPIYQEVIFYPDIDLSHMQDNVLIILDLRTKGDFQKLIAPELLAKYLVEKGLPISVHSIHLLVCDMDAYNHLILYAAKLVNSLAKGGYKNLIVKVPTDLNYDITLIQPPKDKNANWQIYGLIQQPPNEAKRTLLWEGRDPADWLNVPERIVTF